MEIDMDTSPSYLDPQDLIIREQFHRYGLSDLPDDLLSRILGLLPTKDAAITTLISDKFMPAFSDLNDLEFDDYPISHCLRSPNLAERTPGFRNFVDYVLQSYKSRQLRKFTLRFGRFCGDNKRRIFYQDRRCRKGLCHPYLDSCRLHAWISFPLARSVRELDLCINVITALGFHKLPPAIFVCETLEMLKLDSNLDLDVHDVKAFPIRLPRLKLLHLRTLLFKDNEFVNHLVKSCPLLEDLLLDCWWDSSDVIAISSPSLLNLDLSPKHHDQEGFYNLIFQTLNLQSFTYWANLATDYSIPIMNALVRADIGIDIELGMDDCSNLCSILKSCSTVSHLCLTHSCLTCLDSVVIKNRLPMFHNLHHLELARGCCLSSWDKVLVQFLECCPSLQTLLFSEGFCNPSELRRLERYELERECWRTTQTIPSCCKSHLKKIVIKEYLGLQRELDLLQFLLQKALILESLDISLFESIDLALDPVSVQSTIREIPRVSRFCSIRVL